MDDSVRLRIFLRSLIKSASKWYIELKGDYCRSFNDLEMTFLTHYQFLIRYDVGTEILNPLHQNNTTHIYDHIHEWQRRRRMVKNHIPKKILTEWFTKSLLPPISRDVAMAMVATEGKAIFHSQHLDFIYSQSVNLYDIIPISPPRSIDPRQPLSRILSDGVVGSIPHASINQLVDQMGKLSIQSHPSTSGINYQTIIVPPQSSEVNSVQSMKPKNP
jgi:hypothetical protein